jgi:hypothetical protein
MQPAELAKQLWDCLWQDYRDRVPDARTYQQMIEMAGGTIANDHIAFRTLRMTVNPKGDDINLGIPYLANIVEALGYEAAGEYHFPEQFLYARHYRHPEQSSNDLPKLFMSELIVEDLPDAIALLIRQTVQCGEFAAPALCLKLNALGDNASGNIATQTIPTDLQIVLNQLVNIFNRPWPSPKRSVLEAINAVSQYGAWVMLHGYSVNHFTGYVNRHQTGQYKTIEQTVAGLIQLGVPMKAALEGSVESGLCQTATQAVLEPVWVEEDATGALIQIPWPYAYYEIAERYPVATPAGDSVLFEGFLKAQAQQLFEMTRQQV